MSEIITVDVKIPRNEIYEASKIPLDYSVQMIIDEIIDIFELPHLDMSARPINYVLRSLQQERILAKDETILSAQIQQGDTLELQILNGNDDYELPPTMKMPGRSEINVVLSVMDLNHKETIILSTVRPVGDLIRQIIENYGLPARDNLNQIIKYKLQSKALGRFLDERLTLLEAQIPPLDRLTLHRDEIAGNGGYEDYLKKQIPRQSFFQGIKRKFPALMHTIFASLKKFSIPSDPVDCTVFAPPVVSRGGTCSIQILAHLPEYDGIVDAIAKEHNKDARLLGTKSLEIEIFRKSTLIFHLIIPAIKINHPVKNLVWEGLLNYVDFTITVPENYKLREVIGTVIISCEQIPVGHIKFKLTVNDAENYPPVKATGSAYTYKKAFISYSSKDRVEVLKRVQMLNILRIKTFQDILSLKAGEGWERELYQYIEKSDLFLLFWSNAAKQSERVLKEIQYALEIKKGDDHALPEIIPVMIEGPPPVPPPDELAHLHFNDYFLYLIAGSK